MACVADDVFTSQAARGRRMARAVPAPPKVGLAPRGAALAVVSGACLAAGYALVNDFDVRRTKKSVLGGALGFLGGYLFLRGSRFDDAQTAAVVTTALTVASLFAYSRLKSAFH